MSDSKPTAGKASTAKPRTSAAKPSGTAAKTSGSAAKKPPAVPPPPAPPVTAPVSQAPASTPPPGGYAPPVQPVYAPVALRPEEERNAAMLSHLLSLVAIVVSASWIVALVYYLIYKDRGAYVRSHTATELNFQLTMLIGLIAGFLLSIVLVGFLVIFAIPVLMIVFGIIATMKASRGEWYVYPIAIRFVR